MSILFMMPHWAAPSEVWIQRMIEQLQDEICLIASENAEPLWKNKIEGFSLSQKVEPAQWWKKALNPFYFEKTIEDRLIDRAHEKGVNKVLVNFANYAVRKINILENIDAEIFIHCHGWDIAFDGFQDAPPHVPLHNDAYIEKLTNFSFKHHFIANSIYSKEKLLSIGVPEEKITVKYFGVEKFKSSTQETNEIVKILYLGRLIECKGADIVLKAYERMRDKGVVANLIIAGDGPLRRACETLKEESKYSSDIEFTGTVSREQAIDLFTSSDIFTAHTRKGPSTNREEAFGVSFIEAMSAGLPVVAGRSGGIPESLLHKKTAFLVEQNDVEGHSERLAELVLSAELRSNMGEAGRQHVLKNFSIEKEREALYEILGCA